MYNCNLLLSKDDINDWWSVQRLYYSLENLIDHFFVDICALCICAHLITLQLTVSSDEYFWIWPLKFRTLIFCNVCLSLSNTQDEIVNEKADNLIHYDTQLMPSVVFLLKCWWHGHVQNQNEFFAVSWIATAYNHLDAPFVNKHRHVAVCIVSWRRKCTY